MEGCGGKVSHDGLQGSDPLDPCPNSISARTISLPLSDIVSQTEQDSYLMPRLEKKLHHTKCTLPVCILCGSFCHNRPLFATV